jgi:hypothetical protein
MSLDEDLTDTSWEFRARIETRSMGPELQYTVVYLPDALVSALNADGPVVRVYAVINEIDVEAAFQRAHDRWSMMVSRALQKKIGAKLGDTVEIRFSLAPSDAVDIPDALRDAIRSHDVARETFTALSAGKKRALAHRVASAKTAPTRSKRVDDVVAALAGGADGIAAFFARKMSPEKPTAVKKSRVS